MRPVFYWQNSSGYEVVIFPNAERPSEWDFLVDGHPIGYGFYDAVELASRLARHETGLPEWDEGFRRIKVPEELARWSNGYVPQGTA